MFRTASEQIKPYPDELVPALLSSGPKTGLCVIDSCGTGHRGSRWLIAAVEPVDTFSVSNPDPCQTLRAIDEILSGDRAAVFTISYDFGQKLERATMRKAAALPAEPDMFVSLFDCLTVHDYVSGETFTTGNSSRFDDVRELIKFGKFDNSEITLRIDANYHSNFTKEQYLEAIEKIKEYIRRGDTYQTNLTQQITVDIPNDLSPESIFLRMRKCYPAPFSAYIDRGDSTVISGSPERFFRVAGDSIEASPIKGTRPRGPNSSEDVRLRNELLSSEKDRAENIMIVDLLRNDLGRVCDYGSVGVRELCVLEEHPTLFHLVSTIEGRLRRGMVPSDIIRALFPCGSITGAPKIRTMQIINEIESVPRGLSMGAIGIYVPDKIFGLPATLDLSVAIRTMVIRDAKAVFNVGGGIVIDSEPEAEYEESLIKAKAVLGSLGLPSKAIANLNG